MLLSIIRVIKFSFQDVVRNIWLSLVTIIILVLALFTVNMLLVVKVVGNAAVGAVEEKIDINLFLSPDSKEDQIESLKTKIGSLSEVKEVKYISKDEALQQFKKKHEENTDILQALKELGKNPLASTLVITPKNLSDFDDLANQLYVIEDEIIESRNFSNYKIMIDKIEAITNKVSEAAIFLAIVFIFITILVIYNSVKVAIYTHRKEIAIMRLVGASNWFIQTPYLISSMIYTLVGIILIMIIFLPFLNLLQPYLETFFVNYNVNLINYFYGNAIGIFGIQFVIATLINMLASLLAVRRYSRV